jgi:hypothetical protein
MKAKYTSITAPPCDNQDVVLGLFTEPKLIGLIGDANSGKSNMLYWIIKALRDAYQFNLYSYGLRAYVVGEQKIFSVEQLEVIHDSIIIIDEFASLFDVDDRKQKKQIENTLRLIFHRNNVVLFSGVPENVKKFIASKLQAVIYKQCALSDFINGSRTKSIIMNYSGDERGSAMLSLDPNKAIVWDGRYYHKVTIPYVEEGDTKINNADILKKRTEKRS